MPGFTACGYAELSYRRPATRVSVHARPHERFHKRLHAGYKRGSTRGYRIQTDIGYRLHINTKIAHKWIHKSCLQAGVWIHIFL